MFNIYKTIYISPTYIYINIIYIYIYPTRNTWFFLKNSNMVVVFEQGSLVEGMCVCYLKLIHYPSDFIVQMIFC